MPQQRESRPVATRTAPQNTTNADESTEVPRCKRCKRPLIRDVSVIRGCGWRCAAHLRREAAA